MTASGKQDAKVLMDLELTDDQQLLRDTTRAFLERESPLTGVRALLDDPVGFDPKAWKQGAELGWFSLLVGEDDGGGSVSGNGVHDLTLIAAELGRLLFPGPVLETNVVAFALARWGTPAQRSAHLPGIVAGDMIAVWAHGPLVQDAAAADLFLVDTGDAHVLVPAAAAGVTIEPLESFDLTRRFASVHFADLDGHEVVAVEAERLLDLAVVLQCAESVGAIAQLFDITRQYALDRVAFGRPIGSFQAIKHRLAEMVGWIESSKAAVAAAAIAVWQGDDAAAELASAAKSYIGAQAPLVTRGCLQIHGGIGYTWEHDLHLYLRRVESSRALYGSPEEHLDRLASILAI